MGNGHPRTALLLKTAMNISRALNMRPFFQFIISSFSSKCSHLQTKQDIDFKPTSNVQKFYNQKGASRYHHPLSCFSNSNTGLIFNIIFNDFQRPWFKQIKLSMGDHMDWDHRSNSAQFQRCLSEVGNISASFKRSDL